jgi:hypothetical protein
MSTRDSIANSDSHCGSSSVSNWSLRAVKEDCWARDRRIGWLLTDAVKTMGLGIALKAPITLRLGGMYAKVTATELLARQTCR